MNDKKFKELIQEGLEELPSKIRDKMENVALVVEDKPSSEQRSNFGNKKLFGLYQGTPQSKRNSAYGKGALPDKITIFKEIIEDKFDEEEDIKDKVKQVVWHEVAHHFGFDESEVRKLEKQRF
ncbi:MAG: metallopeptidase family protein [Candidatus Paceibacterota bacterium]